MKTPPFTVIKDTREQDGWTFERFDTRYHTCTGMVLQKLETGDYSLKGMENIFCIERKGSVAELAQNLGKDKYRFFAEIERMKSIKHSFLILEFSLNNVMMFPEGSNIPEEKWEDIHISNKYMLKMLTEIQINSNIQVVFCDSRKNAKLFVASLMKRINEMYSK
jgi:hypothetical protein